MDSQNDYKLNTLIFNITINNKLIYPSVMRNNKPALPIKYYITHKYPVMNIFYRHLQDKQ